MADKALLLGINDYKNISDLRGCVNDIRNIKKLLVETFGFDGENNIRMLSNEDVVLQNVNDGFKWLYEGLEAGDRAVFHFSGHGSYVDSSNDDELTDEILCLWDMDWDDVNSYLIDDDLGTLTEGLPEGAQLTVILDNCNSGTGTRAISGGRSFRNTDSLDSKTRLVIESDTINSAPPSKQQKSRSMFDDAEASFRPTDETPVVFARFIYPPEALRPDVIPGRIRNLGKSLGENDLNHTLLAGARDDQTAADASIDGVNQGAFSHYLCNASRQLGVTIAVSEVVKEAKANLISSGYSQIPQLEGIGKSDRLFGGEADPIPVIDEESTPPAANDMFRNDLDSINNTPQSGLEPMEVFSRLVDLQDRFMQLGATVLGGAIPGHSTASGRAQRSANEAIVYVHGISRHVSGYSDAWFSAMAPHLSRSIPKREVLWSDLVNPRSLSALPGGSTSREMSQMAEMIKKELQNRQRLVVENLPAAGNGQRSVAQLDRGDGFAIDDFVRYMTNTAIRNTILQRFDQVVQPLLASGTTVHIIAHSWGTVVSYEGLRNMDGLALPGKVENLILAGSALSIGTVQSNLFGRVGDGRRPNHVNNITNLDAGGDIVGGPIKGTFVIDDEHVGLAPTGCRTIPFTNIAFNPACAHSSYFKSDNVAVNRDLFARSINS